MKLTIVLLGLTLTNLHILCRMCTVAQQPVLTVEMLMKRMFRGVLFCPPDGAAREHDS